MGPEAKIEKAVCDYARRRGCYTRKFKSTSQRGVPDRLFITSKGKVFFIEFKAEGKEPTKLQTRELNLINGKGGLAHWVDSTLLGKAIVKLYC